MPSNCCSQRSLPAGALLVQSERDLMGIAAALLTEAGGRGSAWEEAGVTVAQLSEQLLMSGKGIKASVDTLDAYRERMLTAIRIVMRNPCRPCEKLPEFGG